RLFQRVASRLTGKQKAVFVLKEIEDRDTKEIAEILKCGESTVRNHLFNARRILRREIAKICPGLVAGRRP
ncbi:MAG TPA: sigma factor-like helix-turn-helix DNA-binding protein, partial [Thermoanaerobaculia bacterium]